MASFTLKFLTICLSIILVNSPTASGLLDCWQGDCSETHCSDDYFIKVHCPSVTEYCLKLDVKGSDGSEAIRKGCTAGSSDFDKEMIGISQRNTCIDYLKKSKEVLKEQGISEDTITSATLCTCKTQLCNSVRPSGRAGVTEVTTIVGVLVTYLLFFIN